MKKLFSNKILQSVSLLLLVMLLITACEKDRDGNPTTKPSSNPQALKIAPDSSSGGNVVVLEGTNLGGMKSIVFEKGNVPASFNPNLSTTTSLVFRVPDTAFGGTQKVIFTNELGVQTSINFKVIALASVTSATSYSFAGGTTTIVLTGNNLDDVSKVTIDGGGNEEATIGPKTRKSLTITMPVSTASSAKLKITNSSGTITTTQEFVNADQAYVFFRDAYGNGEVDASWGDAGVISSTEFVSGTKSLGKKFAKGNWHNLGFGWNWIPKGPYNYLSFWIKGGLIDHDVWIFANSDGGPGHDQAQPASNKINAKAGAWTYYKIPLATLNLWADGTAANNFTINKFGFFLKGPDNADETLYVDDVMFIK